MKLKKAMKYAKQKYAKHNKYNYIAVDRTGYIYAYENKPKKMGGGSGFWTIKDGLWQNIGDYTGGKEWGNTRRKVK